MKDKKEIMGRAVKICDEFEGVDTAIAAGVLTCAYVAILDFLAMDCRKKKSDEYYERYIAALKENRKILNRQLDKTQKTLKLHYRYARRSR
jgi:hypothetical protein